MKTLNVFREHESSYQKIGSLAFGAGNFSFSYDAAYLECGNSQAISQSLPLQEKPFSQDQASPFFSGLAPEGNMKKLVAASIHSDFFADALSRLNDESIGGLVFNTSNHINRESSRYIRLNHDELKRLRDTPQEVSFEMGMATRRSLSGAQSKVGLYHHGDDPLQGWYYPSGCAPSTHIIKTPEPVFPDQTVNEALCLETARNCGFDTAEWALIPIEDGEPLLASRRFDRIVAEGSRAISGLPAPRRIHQEDFCQASSLMPDMKYEPTSGHYLSRCGHVITDCSHNPFGDRALFLQEIFFDYLIGNCDNHLKNHSMIWNESWTKRELSPLYDVVCTTIYPTIYLEMGVGLCESRRITDVSGSDIEQAGTAIGIPAKLCSQLYRDVWNDFLPALEKAEQVIADAGFESVHRIANHIRKEFEEKVPA